MPKAIMDFLGCSFFFWSNEESRLHVHVSKGSPKPNATKFWVSPDDVSLAFNNGEFSDKELRLFKGYIWRNREKIIAKWYSVKEQAE